MISNPSPIHKIEVVLLIPDRPSASLIRFMRILLWSGLPLKLCSTLLASGLSDQLISSPQQFAVRSQLGCHPLPFVFWRPYISSGLPRRQRLWRGALKTLK